MTGTLLGSGRFARLSLAAADMTTGRDEAARRFKDGKGRADRVPTPDEVRARNECESVRAEIAVMRWTGAPVYFPTGPPTHDVPDVRPDIEVRWRSKSWHDLIVRNSDVLSRRFVLVKGNGPIYELRGWIYGTDAELHPDWRRDVGAYGLRSWFVPEKYLRPMSTLAKYGERQR